MNSPRQTAMLRLATCVAFAVAVASAVYTFTNYYAVREIVVGNIEALAPTNAPKTLEVIEAQLSPSGDASLVRQLLQSQHEHARLLQQGWLNHALAQERQLKAQLVLWLLVSGALLVSLFALDWKRNAL